MTHARFTKQLGSLSLDIDLPIAGITALWGPAGSGKTLLLHVLAGFATPRTGRILLDDAILFDADAGVNLPPRRRNAAYIGSEDSLFPNMTLAQNLKFAAARFPRLERHRRVTEMLERFQLGGSAKARPHELNAAQKLRASAARALVGEPKLLLLDERAWDEVLLREIKEATTAAIVLVSGDLDLIWAMATSLVIMEGGRILQRGAPREVLDHPESVEVARSLGIANLLQGAIAALDPGRNTSRIEFERFSLEAPYLKGHFLGDRIWVAVDAAELRVHGGNVVGANTVPAQLLRASERRHTVRLEFEGPLTVEISREEYDRQRDNKEWQVEFPAESLKILQRGYAVTNA